MTHRQLRTWAIAGTVAAFALSGCAAPKTPRQALDEAYGAFGVSVGAFNVYASQRPFCGQPQAKAPPLCADAQVVIDGDAAANRVADALELADKTIKTVGVADTQWQALVAPLKSLADFKAFVAGVVK